MFWNIYGKRVISTLRDKDTLIWTWVFPLMMSTLFFFTFSSLDTEYQLKVIPIGVVADDAYKQDSTFTGVMDTVSKEGEEQLFKVYPVDSAEQADTLLDKGPCRRNGGNVQGDQENGGIAAWNPEKPVESNAVIEVI